MEKVDVRNRRDQNTPGSIDGLSPRTHSRAFLIDCSIPMLAVRERSGRSRVIHLPLVYWGWIWEID
jgi:hypothetical protein